MTLAAPAAPRRPAPLTPLPRPGWTGSPLQGVSYGLLGLPLAWVLLGLGTLACAWAWRQLGRKGG